MKALVMNGHGDLSCLAVADVPEPQITSRDQVKLRIAAAALNRLDLFTLAGLPGVQLAFPHVLAGDGAGVVEDVGDDVVGVAPGDRVLVNPGLSCYECEFCLDGEHSLCVEYRLLGEHVPGLAAEYATVPYRNVFKIPEPPAGQRPIDWDEAAAFGLVTLTAWRMVRTKAQVGPADTVLVWGIGGGVAVTALRVAKLLGAKVIATSSSDAKLAKASELGADIVLNHAETDVVAECRALTGKRGVDVVIESPGEATWKDSIKVLARGGRLVTCGATTGPHVVTDVRRLFWNQYTIMGSTMGNVREFRTIVDLLGEGKLRPIIDSVYPLDEAIGAVGRMHSGEQMGKIVIAVKGEEPCVR